MWKILSVFVFVTLIVCQPSQDFVQQPPGMQNVTMYSGYLKTISSTRQLHYVLIQSEGNPSKDPLVLWLNGGPGCSSLLGMLQEIGPYIVGNNYSAPQMLTRNNHSWTKSANVLFLESPAGVGFSINTEDYYHHDDNKTAEDTFAALKDFLTTKFPSYRNSSFFIAGQSYAGKYIPDLAAKILDRRAEFSINLKGILVGNGVMSFLNDELHKSSVEFLYDHDFINPHLMDIYRQACLKDYNSPRCRFFNFEFYEIRARLNPYNVYEVCTSRTTEGSVLNRMLEQNLGKTEFQEQLNEIKQCHSDNGIIQYLNAHKSEYHIKASQNWFPCASISYTIDQKGSIDQYKRIMLNQAVKIWLYSGDWDDVVPYTDTLKNLKNMRILPAGPYKSWFIGEDHAGFFQVYNYLTLITVKGAGHMVPEDKREASYQMFYNFINGRPVDTPVY